MKTREILIAIEVLCLAFMVSIMFLTYPRKCEVIDSNNILHVDNCAVIYQYEK